MNQEHEERLHENPKFDVKGFGSDALIYAIGQGILLIIGLAQGFMIPKYLSIETYGYWQVFLLYAAYAGVLHLGFTEGIFMRWAGKDISDFTSELGPALKFLIFEQVIVVGALCLAEIFLFDAGFRFVGPMVLAYSFLANLLAFFMYVIQSIRKFKLLMCVMIAQNAFFLLIIILIFLTGYSDYKNVIYAYLLCPSLTLVFYISYYDKHLWSGRDSIKAIWSFGRDAVKMAFFLYVSLLVFTLSWTIDRVLVSTNFPIEQFAIYAFALSCAAIIMSFTVAVSNVFFPYISNTIGALKIEVYKLIKPTIIFCWGAVLAIFFPLKLFISFFLPQYVACFTVVAILFCAIGFSSVINILHVNYYRAYRKQLRFFVASAITLAVLLAANLIAIKLVSTLESVAMGTLISYGIWYCINEYNFQHTIKQQGKTIVRDFLSILVYSAVFWFSSCIMKGLYYGLCCYILGFVLVTYVFFGAEIRKLTMILKTNIMQTK
jgi:O-antigen/teichoic acid export membrane protein